MRKTLILSLVLFSYSLMAQIPSSNYSAVLFNSKTMIEKFNKKKCCKPSSKNKGVVKTTGVKPTKKETKDPLCLVMPYRIAIKDQPSEQKLLSFNEIFPKIDINNVPVTCKKKDTSVLLTSSNLYTLPQNENLLNIQ